VKEARRVAEAFTRPFRLSKRPTTFGRALSFSVCGQERGALDLLDGPYKQSDGGGPPVNM